jgi:hypothetical protein
MLNFLTILWGFFTSFVNILFFIVKFETYISTLFIQLGPFAIKHFIVKAYEQPGF